METLLETHPQYVGRVVLLQIAVPTRTDVRPSAPARSAAAGVQTRAFRAAPMVASPRTHAALLESTESTPCRRWG